MYYMLSPDNVIIMASNEVGYVEKSRSAYIKDKSVIYNKFSGAGNDNITLYGYEMHKLYPQTMDFPAAWCDAFIDWCFYRAYGKENATKLLCGRFDDYTVASAQLYKNANRWITKNPVPGDQIFFKNNVRICHTGLVYKVDKKYVYTIEGNTNNKDVLVSNGGTVAKKRYSLNYSNIAGYGRPKYDLRATCQLGDCNADVVYLQQRLMAKGYPLPKYGADGDFGQETLMALKSFMNDNEIRQGLMCTMECWEKLL